MGIKEAPDGAPNALVRALYYKRIIYFTLVPSQLLRNSFISLVRFNPACSKVVSE